MTEPTRSTDSVADVIVVGGGLSGLAAALTLVRARRAVVVIDAGEPRNAPAAHSHGYLTRDGAGPLELLRMGRLEVRGYGGQVIDGTVGSIDRRDDGLFVARVDGGSDHVGRRLLVTTGLVDRYPDLPGLHERWGRDVVHCPYCFGWELRDRAVGVLAAGPGAVMQALMWRQCSADVTLFRHTGPPASAEQERQLARRGVPIVPGEVANVEIRKDRLTGVRLVSGRVVPREVVVVGPWFEARHELLDPLGVQVVEHPLGIGAQVKADPAGFTGVPGVWVAGNVVDVTAGVMQSAASGVSAAAAINADLILAEATQ
jgi:thioredoxin reductase